jgi:hypothetical protein
VTAYVALPQQGWRQRETAVMVIISISVTANHSGRAATYFISIFTNPSTCMDFFMENDLSMDE